MEKDLLTIPEFAKAAGKKKQGIYEQVKNENSKLFPFVVLQRGKPYIKREALKEVYGIEQADSQADSQESSQEKSQESQADSQEGGQVGQEQGQGSQANSQESSQGGQAPQGQEQNIISFLQEQLREKDRQLAEKDKQIEKIQQLLDQEQRLHANTNRLLAEYREKAEAPQENTEDTIVNTVKQEADQEPQKKRSWWHRIFFED